MTSNNGRDELFHIRNRMAGRILRGIDPLGTPRKTADEAAHDKAVDNYFVLTHGVTFDRMPVLSYESRQESRDEHYERNQAEFRKAFEEQIAYATGANQCSAA